MTKFHVDLQDTAHRPWPLPTGRPAIRMTWENLLFAHWPVPADILQNLIDQQICRTCRPSAPSSAETSPATPLTQEPLPPSRRLEIDTIDGQAWIGVVPFIMNNVHIHPVGGIPGAVRFPELNVRTYVSVQGRPGVFFFSLDAASLATVIGARVWYGLPYYYAKMSSRINNDNSGNSDLGPWTTYTSMRRYSARPNLQDSSAQFRARYRPTSPPSQGQLDPLAHWLTERYCLYSINRQGKIHRADIHHAVWPLQQAEAEIALNTMTDPLDLPLPEQPPLLHYAKELHVLAWPPKPL